MNPDVILCSAIPGKRPSVRKHSLAQHFTRLRLVKRGNGESPRDAMSEGGSPVTLHLKEHPMASCAKCGKTKIPKRPGQPRACKRCGVLIGPAAGYLRNGAAR